MAVPRRGPGKPAARGDVRPQSWYPHRATRSARPRCAACSRHGLAGTPARSPPAAVPRLGHRTGSPRCRVDRADPGDAGPRAGGGTPRSGADRKLALARQARQARLAVAARNGRPARRHGNRDRPVVALRARPVGRIGCSHRRRRSAIDRPAGIRARPDRGHGAPPRRGNRRRCRGQPSDHCERIQPVAQRRCPGGDQARASPAPDIRQPVGRDPGPGACPAADGNRHPDTNQGSDIDRNPDIDRSPGTDPGTGPGTAPGCGAGPGDSRPDGREPHVPGPRFHRGMPAIPACHPRPLVDADSLHQTVARRPPPTDLPSRSAPTKRPHRCITALRSRCARPVDNHQSKRSRPRGFQRMLRKPSVQLTRPGRRSARLKIYHPLRIWGLDRHAQATGRRRRAPQRLRFPDRR